MANVLRAFRRRVITPGIGETRLERRGFHVKSPAARELLETIGEMFLAGYAHAAETDSAAAAEERLEELPTRFRGFAYEGAAMGCTVVDALPFGRRRRIPDLLAGRGDQHVYMVYVGIGWAMARLPRFRWPDYPLDPLLRWLVLDGYGFHQAYFHTDRYVHGQHRDPAFPWPPDGPRGYAARAIDQGIGRAMWFVAGADADLAATMIDRFPHSRRPDLYSGAGLAATYAGGADEEELHGLRKRAGDLWPQVAQGSAFAAEARLRAGLEVPHTAVATRVLCGLTPREAADVCARNRPDGPTSGPEPAYEAWRRRIADELASVGRS